MDQGLAAVLGAAVGVTGTVGAASLTYMAARRQATEQWLIDHVKTLRTERRECYLSVLRAVEPVERAAQRLMVNSDDAAGTWIIGSEEVLAQATHEVVEAAHGVTNAMAQVRLTGPKDMADSADILWGEVEMLRSQLVALEWGGLDQAGRVEVEDRFFAGYQLALDRFADQARLVIEEPRPPKGSMRERRRVLLTRQRRGPD